MTAAQGDADLILHGGTVYPVAGFSTGTPNGAPPSAVAVKGGRIVAVGTDEEVRAWAGPRTQTVNLAGRMLLPGFQDAHVHPVEGGMQLLRCDLTNVDSAPEYLDAIGRYAASHPAADWILGGGWSMPAFPRGVPRREPLDDVVSDRPVYLPNRDGHSAWVNTRALELAGVTRHTPDPPDGRIERDEDGTPTGALHEGAMDLVARLLPAATPESALAGLLAAQQYLHSLGITGWQDAIVDGPIGGATTDTYLTAASAGQLTARVIGALWWERDQGEEQVEGLIERRARAGDGRFRATSVKIMQDGVCETFTAAMLQPYLDGDGHPTGGHGISFFEAEALRRYVARLDREGFQVHFHALGDRAVRDSLDAIAAARAANGPTDHRHHLAHLQVVNPDDVPRFAELGAVANCQPLWARNEPQMTELTIPFLGPDRARQQYPFASLERSGATLAFGSDWPVSTPDPLEELHVAVNRLPAPDGDVPVFLPEQRLSLASALRAFTMGSAYVNHQEETTGSIEVGKYADLTVLDRDLFAVPREEIYAAKVTMTLVEGEPVFAA